MFRLECLRRVAILTVIPVSAILIFYTRPEYLRLTVVNWEQRRDREIAALLSEEARQSLAAYVAEETAGHVVSLRSAEWGTFLKDARQTLSGHPPSPDWKRSLGPVSSSRSTPTLFFQRDDSRFVELLATPEMASGFAYLQFDHETLSVPTFGLSLVETQYSVDDPPQQLIHPLRQAGWWVLLVGIAIYGLIPWPQEHARQIRFSTPARTFLTDLVGVLLYGSTTVLWAMLVLSPDIPGHGEWLQMVVLSGVFGLMALMGVSIILIALSQSQLQLEWSDTGLTFRTFRQSVFHAWDNLVSLDVGIVTDPKAKAIRRLGLLASLVNWRAAGPALLVQTESRALRFATRQGPELTIDFGNASLRNLWRLITELQSRSITVTPATQDFGESGRRADAPRRWPIHLTVFLLAIPILLALARTFHAQ